jgi:hypothetical protein
LHSAASCLGFEPSSYIETLAPASGRGCSSTIAYIVFLRLLLIVVFAEVIIILVILLVKLALKILLVELLIGKSLTSEPVDSTGDELLLDILTELVVKLKTLLNIRSSVVIILLGGRLGGREEVEERLSRDGLLDDAGLLGV